MGHTELASLENISGGTVREHLHFISIAAILPPMKCVVLFKAELRTQKFTLCQQGFNPELFSCKSSAHPPPLL